MKLNKENARFIAGQVFIQSIVAGTIYLIGFLACLFSKK